MVHSMVEDHLLLKKICLVQGSLLLVVHSTLSKFSKLASQEKKTGAQPFFD